MLPDCCVFTLDATQAYATREAIAAQMSWASNRRVGCDAADRRTTRAGSGQGAGRALLSDSDDDNDRYWRIAQAGGSMRFTCGWDQRAGVTLPCLLYMHPQRLVRRRPAVTTLRAAAASSHLVSSAWEEADSTVSTRSSSMDASGQHIHNQPHRGP